MKSTRPGVPTSTGSAHAILTDTGRFRVSQTTFEKGSLPSHYHDRACLTVVLHGAFTESFRGRAITCGEGDRLLKPAGERHSDSFAGSRQIIIEPDDHATEYLGEAPGLFDRVTGQRDGAAWAIGTRIGRELELNDRFTLLAVEGLTLELLSVALRAGAGPLPGRAPPPWLARVRESLHEIDAPGSIAELAGIAAVNPAYLARCFRKCFGESIGRYARRLRLERAASQLVESDASLTSIALRNGFSDQSHFTRAFRARWGVTPRAYRLVARRR